jgi:glycosyl transferase family 25
MDQIAAVVYINLNYRKDRKFEIEQELARMEIKADRFSAIQNANGLIGCLQSHLAVLELAKKNKYTNILILEDDFQFLVSKEELDSELKTFFNEKIPYDVLMLGYNLLKSAPFRKNVLKVLDAQTASAYIVHESFYDTLIECYRKALPMFVSTNMHIYANDQVWKRLQPISRWYALRIRAGVQRESYSDTTGKIENYGV